MQPVPAAVTAWRYVGSIASPDANTPSTEVRVPQNAREFVLLRVGEGGNLAKGLFQQAGHRKKIA